MLTNPNIAQVVNSEELKTYYLYTVVYADDKPPLTWTNYDETIPYRGLNYEPIPIKHSDMTQSSDGKVSDLNITVGNADRFVQFYLENYDLIGKDCIITQVFEGIEDVIETKFKIKSASAKKDVATISLSIGFEVLKLKTPGRKMYSRYCMWTFRDAATCKYAGSDIDCEQTWEACRSKENTINFGGFPGIINERFYF